MLSWSKPTSKLHEDHKSNHDNKGKGKVKSHSQLKSKENISSSYSKVRYIQKLTSTYKFPKLLNEEYKYYKKKSLYFIYRKLGYNSKMYYFNSNYVLQNDSKLKISKSQ